MEKQSPDIPNGSALKALFWKDEILQVMYWLQGEELAETVSVNKLLIFLNIDFDDLTIHLKKGVQDGYLIQMDEELTKETGYTLSETGKQEAAVRFIEGFEGMRKQGHGECGPECICQWEGADACEHGHHH